MKLETVDEAVEDNGVKICVHGPAGSGKTFLTSTTGTSIIVLSAESGLLSLKRVRPEIKDLMRIIQIKTMADLNGAYQWLISGKMADWVAIDSGSEIAEVLLGDKKKSGSGDPRGAYGDMADDMMETFRMLRDMKDYNVMMTAKQTFRKDDRTGVTSYVPMFPGKILTSQVPYMFDEIFALRVEPHPENPGETMRVLQTGKDVAYDCKDRSGMLDMFEQPNLANIARKINGQTLAPPKPAEITDEGEAAA